MQIQLQKSFENDENVDFGKESWICIRTLIYNPHRLILAIELTKKVFRTEKGIEQR